MYRTALSNAISQLDETTNSECPGKFTIEQFLLLIKHFNSSSPSVEGDPDGDSNLNKPG